MSIGAVSEAQQHFGNNATGLGGVSASSTDGLELCGGLVNTQHFQQRVINVSNAPPVALKQSASGEWEIKQGSGGLVSCVDPVMAVGDRDREYKLFARNIHFPKKGMNMNT